MNVMFNAFNNAEVPTLTLCKPNKDLLYALPLAYSIKESIKYNAQSQLDFYYPKYYENKMTGINIADPAYDYIKGKMLVEIDNRFYIIGSCPEDSSGGTPVKNIVAMSLESEMLAHRVTLNGTYQFKPLLDLLLGLVPSWSTGYIDPTLLSLSRSFTGTGSNNNSTLYGFLTTDVEKAFNCVFSFDSYTKTVSAVANLVPYPETNITLSLDNLMSKIEYKEITDEICTCLSCYGGGSLDIHYVNPLGNNNIYNFTYFKNTYWMTQGLIDVLNLWEANVVANKSGYTTQLTNLETLDGEMVILLADLSDLNAQLYSLIEVKNARTQQGISTTDIDTQITTKNVAIASKSADISSKQQNIDTIRISLRKIVHSLFFTTQMSFINIKEDIQTIGTLLTSISVNWPLLYNSNSTYPGFSNAALTAATPTITSLIISAQNENLAFYNYLAAGFSNYPPSNTDLNTVKNYINTEMGTLNSLYGTFQSIIPSTAFTMLLDEIITELTSFLEIIYYPSNMTTDQYLELSHYIYENTYLNNSIIITPSLTPAQVQSQSQGLYDCGEIILARTCVPRYEFTGEFGNLMALPEFAQYAEEIDIGKTITIIKGDGEVISAVLLEMDITYDKPDTFSMTFGNSLRLDDPTFIYGDLIGPVTPVTTTIPGITDIPIGTIPAPSPISIPTLPTWTVPTLTVPTMPTIDFSNILSGLNIGTTKTYTWVITSPAVGGIPGPRIPTDCTIANFYSQPIGGTSVAYNFEIRSTPGTTGTNIMGSEFITYPANPSGVGSFANPLVRAGQWLWLDISNVSGAVTQLVITMTVTPVLNSNVTA